MDPLRLPRARVPSKVEYAVSVPTSGQETRLPRLGDTIRGCVGADDGLTTSIPLEKQARGLNRRSNNDPAHHAGSLVNGGDRSVCRVPIARTKAKKPTADKPRKSTSLVDAMERVGQLSALDERVLILYHSSLKYGWYADRQANEASASRDTPGPHKNYGPEATYAAVKIQKVARGLLARHRLAVFHGPKNQRAASMIQFAYKRALMRRRIARRVWEKQRRTATRIQAWYRGCRGRDLALALFADRLNNRIANFQRRFRGLRFWRVVAALLYKRKWDAAREIQRVYRGWKGRCCATAVRFEKIRFAQDLMNNSELHAQFMRCEGCSLERCTEESLLRCLMARYLGLHDLVGAKVLGEQGIRQYPSSALFCFIYACLLQSICEDLEVCMAYLSRANAGGVRQHELDQCEQRFYQAALMLRSNDAALHLHLAIFFQSSERNDRAEVHYEKALAEHPAVYPVPGYLERVRTVDRLLLNYHRFCSVFNFRHTNVLVKDVAVAKRGPKIKLRVSKLNHFTVVGPLEPRDSSSLNTVYLTDEELAVLLDNATLLKSDNSTQLGPNDSRGFLKLPDWRNNNARASLSRTSVQQAATNRAKQAEAAKWRPVITQLYQDEFFGLHMKPSDLAKFSTLRSRLRLTKENGEALLKLLVFIDPSVDDANNKRQLDEQLMYRDIGQRFANLRRIMLIPRVLRLRFDRRVAFLQTHMSIKIQSIFRGFRFRAEMRRECLLHEIHRRQVDEVFMRLNANYTRREKRRKSAVAIQRIAKGVQQRRRVMNWRIQAVQIQRIFRGYLGRKRAIAFREGSCTFYMVERVFQRGLEVSGRFLLLSIDKCGLSFRMDGYDVEACTSYHGFLSHQSATSLLCYINWTHAESFCGRELLLQGNCVQITSVASIDPATGECFVNVAQVLPEARAQSATRLAVPSSSAVSKVAPLVDCINAINLRQMSVIGKESTALTLPLKVDDTRQLVDAIVARLMLAPALPMATHELRRKNAAGLIITIAPPPAMHYMLTHRHQARAQQDRARQPRAILKKRKSAMKRPSQSASEDTAPLPSMPAFFPPETVFPVVNSLRGASIGKFFRKKCSRHAITHTRCRCMLPFVSTPAYIETLSLALGPPPPPSYMQDAQP